MVGGDKHLLRRVLQKDERFFGYYDDEDSLDTLIDRFKRRKCKKGEVVVGEDEYHKSVFIIENGEFDVYVSKLGLTPRKIRSLKPTGTIGVWSFVYDEPRGSEVRATSDDCTVWEVDIVDVEKFTYANPSLMEARHRRRALRRYLSHSLFSHIDDFISTERLISAFKKEEYGPGETIFHQNKRENDQRYFIVHEGECEVWVSKTGNPAKKVVTLKSGDGFGELAIWYDRPRTATVKTKTYATLLSLDAKTFRERSVGGSIFLELLFEKHASIEHGGQKYMTAEDFIKAITPPPRGQDESGFTKRTSWLSLKKLECLFHVADTTGSQLISFAEFALLAQLCQQKNPEYEIAFRFADIHNDGKITLTEFLEMQNMLSATGDADYIANTDPVIIDLFGADGKGTLSHEEFEELLRTGRLPNLVQFWHKTSNDLRLANEQWLKMAIRPDIESVEYIEQQDMKAKYPSKYLLAGGVAGAVSRTCIAPLIRLKMLMQTQPQPPRITGIFQGMRLMHRMDGIRGFYKGNWTNVVRIAPTSAFQFFFFEVYKDWLIETLGKEKLGMHEKLVAGGFAGITAASLTYPLDMIRARLTVQNTRIYKGIIHGISTIVRTEGFFALYRGLWPTIVGVFPYIGIDFAVYETLKPHAPKKPNTTETTHFGILICGGLAGAISQTIAFPLELIRRRLQVQGFVESHIHYEGGIWDAMKLTVQREGIRGLYRGLTPNYLKAVPSIGISFMVYESMKKHLGLR